MEKYYCILIAALVLLACNKPERAQKERTPLKVRTMVVAPQGAQAVSRYVGTIEPVHETPLSMQTTGRVVSVSVKNGQRVTQGQTILTIDDTQAKNALESARAALTHAQDGYDRARRVYEKGVVSDQKMVEIESQLAQARSLYDAAKQQLAECTLKAPCGGVVSGLQVEVGQSILPGTKICSLLDVSGFSVRFTVPENEINGVSVHGGRLEGTVECAAVDTVLPVTITETGVTANPLTHTYEVVARISGGADILKTGMVGVVRIQSAVADGPAENNIVIPARCVLLKQEGPTVWVVENGEAVRRSITTEGFQAEGVRVTSGLRAGDTLIIDGYQKLYNGCHIAL